MEVVMFKKVFVNGTLIFFIVYLIINYAKTVGEYVCVGIDTDDR